MVIDHNPLVISVLEILQTSAAPMTEHELIVALRPQLDAVPGMADAPQLALFQTHFLVMNALYQLQRDLLADDLYLSISPLAIALEPVSSGQSAALRDASEQPLADYYLDFTNLRDTDLRGVEALLDQFWQGFVSRERQPEALAELELPADADWPAIQQRYRQLAARLHPDRGGDPQRFMQVREAFEVLRRHYAP